MMEVIEETPSSATTSRRSSGRGSTSEDGGGSSSSSSSTRHKSTSTSTDLTDLAGSSASATPTKKRSVKSMKAVAVGDDTGLGDYKIEKEGRGSSGGGDVGGGGVDEETSTSNGSCFSCCQSLNQAQLESLKAIARRREQQEAEEVCFSCCHGKTKSKYFRMSYYRNNLSFFLTFLVYLLIQIGLALLQYYLYIESNVAVRIARIGGILINFNSVLVILLVLRRLTTWIRNSAIGRNYLPIDDSIKFHKFVGLFIFVLSLVHTAAHCVNLCKSFSFVCLFLFFFMSPLKKLDNLITN